MGRLGDEIKMLGRMVGDKKNDGGGNLAAQRRTLSPVSSCFLGKKLFDEKGAGGERKRERMNIPL